ncbi:hypothetical protein GWK47_023669 [Chionoecetes opilio]|uniref:Uncharacterized protein n=1 Tax=Chionoecetes opilio TaxID=41210 RepID=A0A8J5CED1_CHIOP|nr:hypothetical protein GWK47_023669 [Chionoecetes opilio]
MAAFSEDPPKYAALHWDGKMPRDVLGSDPGTTSETLAVLSSGPPAYPEGKLLGVPVIDSSTGTAQAEASMVLLEAWGLTGVITTLVFDTTASPSGVHRGAAKLLEQQLDRKVFYLACRHHILEVLVDTPPPGIPLESSLEPFIRPGFMADTTGDYVLPFVVSGIFIVFCGLILNFIPLIKRCRGQYASSTSSPVGTPQDGSPTATPHNSFKQKPKQYNCDHLWASCRAPR